MSNTEIECQLMKSLGMVPGSGYLHGELTHEIVGAAIEVHRHLGPGQLESLYQRALEHELGLRRIPFRARWPVAMTYKGVGIGDLVVDLVIDGRVIVELKSVAGFQPVHIAQVLSYLRAMDLRLGLLINFNVPVVFRGIRRLIR